MFFLPFLAPLAAPAAAAGALTGTTLLSTGFVGASAATASAGLFSGLSLGSALSYGMMGMSFINSMNQASYQKDMGKYQEGVYKMNAYKEMLNANEKDLARRRELIRALASQRASRAAQGIASNEGSPASMLRTDIRDKNYDSLIGEANRDWAVSDQMSKAAYAKTQGDEAYSSGIFKAGASLLDFADRQVYRGTA